MGALLPALKIFTLWFRDLLFRRAEPLFYAFDVLWDEHAKSDDAEEQRRFRNGEDLRYLPH